MRRKIYEVIESPAGNEKISAYDIIMLSAIVVSVVPLAFKEPPAVYRYTDVITTVLFVVDYFLRLITADYKLGKHGAVSFLRYPFTVWAIIDLISILPAITVLNNGFKLFRLFRMVRALRVFRVFKTLRYSKSIIVIAEVIKKSRDALYAVCTFAVAYTLITALIIFNVEGDTFSTFFEAVYWATVSLTTVGYGDIYPVTTAGKVITMISSIFGIAIVALPAGIITAGYMDVINESRKNEEKDK